MGEQQFGRSDRSAWRRPLIVASIVVGSVLALGIGIVTVIAVLTAVGMVHPFASNAADAELKPFDATLEEAGGTKLCSNGDGGYGWDNRVPWSTTYYLVPDAGGISDDLRRTAAGRGYALTPTAPSGLPEPTPDEAFGSGERLQISVYRNADVPLYCSDVGSYGDTHHVGGNDAIVEVDITLPSRPLE